MPQTPHFLPSHEVVQEKIKNNIRHDNGQVERKVITELGKANGNIDCQEANNDVLINSRARLCSPTMVPTTVADERRVLHSPSAIIRRGRFNNSPAPFLILLHRGQKPHSWANTLTRLSSNGLPSRSPILRCALIAGRPSTATSRDKGPDYRSSNAALVNYGRTIVHPQGIVPFALISGIQAAQFPLPLAPQHVQVEGDQEFRGRMSSVLGGHFRPRIFLGEIEPPPRPRWIGPGKDGRIVVAEDGAMEGEASLDPIVLGIPPESTPSFVQGGAQFELPLGGRLLTNTCTSPGAGGQLGRQTLGDAGQRMRDFVRGRRVESWRPGPTASTGADVSGRRTGTLRGRRRRGEGYTTGRTVGGGGRRG